MYGSVPPNASGGGLTRDYVGQEYWKPKFSRSDAENALMTKSENTALLRPSSKQGSFSVSYLRDGKILHTQVDVKGTQYIVIDAVGNEQRFDTMSDVFVYLKVHPLSPPARSPASQYGAAPPASNPYGASPMPASMAGANSPYGSAPRPAYGASPMQNQYGHAPKAANNYGDMPPAAVAGSQYGQAPKASAAYGQAPPAAAAAAAAQYGVAPPAANGQYGVAPPAAGRAANGQYGEAPPVASMAVAAAAAAAAASSSRPTSGRQDLIIDGFNYSTFDVTGETPPPDPGPREQSPHDFQTWKQQCYYYNEWRRHRDIAEQQRLEREARNLRLIDGDFHADLRTTAAGQRFAAGR